MGDYVDHSQVVALRVVVPWRAGLDDGEWGAVHERGSLLIPRVGDEWVHQHEYYQVTSVRWISEEDMGGPLTVVVAVEPIAHPRDEEDGNG